MGLGDPHLMVAKKDGSVRFCLDYCKLNEVTVKDSQLQPLPELMIYLMTLQA